MLEEPKHWKLAITVFPEGPDFSLVQFQNSVNNPNEDIYGTLIKLRVEVMLRRRTILLDDTVKIKQDIPDP